MPRIRFRNFPFRGLAVRLARHGCTNRPFYHMVVMPTHKGRDVTPIEQIGTFDPMINEHNERLVAVNFDRYKYWVAHGAIPTKPILQLLGMAGFLPLHPMTYITADRNNSKLRAAQEQQAETPDTSKERDSNA